MVTGELGLGLDEAKEGKGEGVREGGRTRSLTVPFRYRPATLAAECEIFWEEGAFPSIPFWRKDKRDGTAATKKITKLTRPRPFLFSPSGTTGEVEVNKNWLALYFAVITVCRLLYSPNEPPRN